MCTWKFSKAPRLTVAVLAMTLGSGWCFNFPAEAFSTGVPILFTIDPATIRQRDKETTAVEATVVLKTPSPTFFICQIRSADADKIAFSTIIFRKGDVKGKSEGIVHWKAVRKDCRVKIGAFSTDAPDQELWFTVAIKPKSADAKEPILRATPAGSQ